jgi:hypothetical protein
MNQWWTKQWPLVFEGPAVAGANWTVKVLPFANIATFTGSTVTIHATEQQTGTEKVFDATIATDGTYASYAVQTTDIVDSGDWLFQAWVTISGVLTKSPVVPTLILQTL